MSSAPRTRARRYTLATPGRSDFAGLRLAPQVVKLTAARSRRSPDDHSAHALALEQRGQPAALIPGEDQRVALDSAAAAERALELPRPRVELLGREAQLLDEGGLLAAATLALVANDRAGGSPRGLARGRLCFAGARRGLGQLV